MSSTEPEFDRTADEAAGEPTDVPQPEIPSISDDVDAEDIDFGDLQEAPPATSLRPDEDAHFGVRPVFAPSDEDLAIFVDLDALQDMESHAATNTNVELGGVLLGKQCLDSQGTPFVLVTDCLRAEHYEATKGSFKFTHDTWQQISRQRAQFADDLQMVGWYHTHPGWGVFLSGMDMFICENFFSRPLDLALVIDPCRHDRGFFQWTQSGAAVRRTSGFFLTSSRFRDSELEKVGLWLEEPNTTHADIRSATATQEGDTIVHIQQSPWVAVAILGTLALQFCLLALLAWRLIDPAATPVADADAPPAASMPAAWPSREELREAELNAKARVLDQVLAEGLGAPDQLVASLADRTAEVAQLNRDLAAHRALEESLQSRISTLESDLATAGSEAESSRKQYDRLHKEYEDLKGAHFEQTDKLREIEKGETAAAGSFITRWKWPVTTALLGLVCGAGLASFARRPWSSDEA